jgi:hypothetical protein
MKYLKKYKIFESSEHFESMVNMNLIQDIKDLSLDYLDDGYTISYVVKSIHNYPPFSWTHPEFVNYTLLTGRLKLSYNSSLVSSFEHWTNYKPEYIDEVKESINKYGLTYFFRIYKIGPSGREWSLNPSNSGDHVINKDTQVDILSRIRGMYPNEKIENI